MYLYRRAQEKTLCCRSIHTCERNVGICSECDRWAKVIGRHRINPSVCFHGGRICHPAVRLQRYTDHVITPNHNHSHHRNCQLLSANSRRHLIISRQNARCFAAYAKRLKRSVTVAIAYLCFKEASYHKYTLNFFTVVFSSTVLHDSTDCAVSRMRIKFGESIRCNPYYGSLYHGTGDKQVNSDI